MCANRYDESSAAFKEWEAVVDKDFSGLIDEKYNWNATDKIWIQEYEWREGRYQRVFAKFIEKDKRK